MKIQSTPTQTTPMVPKAPAANAAPANPDSSVEEGAFASPLEHPPLMVSLGSHEGNIHGLAGRALYGAALYGIPSMAGATLGQAGILPAVLIGAGIGASTHIHSKSEAAIFGVTGALVGAGLGWACSQLSGTPYAYAPVVATAVLGAGTQALFSVFNENNQEG